MSKTNKILVDNNSRIIPPDINAKSVPAKKAP